MKETSNSRSNEHGVETRLVAPETNIQLHVLHLCVRVHTFVFSEHQDQ